MRQYIVFKYYTIQVLDINYKMISRIEPLSNLLPFQFVALPKCVVQYTLLQPLFLMIATLFTIDVREKDMFESLS